VTSTFETVAGAGTECSPRPPELDGGGEGDIGTAEPVPVTEVKALTIGPNRPVDKPANTDWSGPLGVVANSSSSMVDWLVAESCLRVRALPLPLTSSSFTSTSPSLDLTAWAQAIISSLLRDDDDDAMTAATEEEMGDCECETFR